MFSKATPKQTIATLRASLKKCKKAKSDRYTKNVKSGVMDTIHWCYKYLVPAFLIGVAVCAGIVLYSWEQEKINETPPNYMYFIPVSCGIVVFITLSLMIYQIPYMMLMLVAMAIMLGLSIWFDVNWEKEREKEWYTQWKIWVLMLLGIVLTVVGFVHGYVKVKAKATN